jgi:hypothetical protein
MSAHETCLTGHQVMLRSGGLRLLLPQASVASAEYREGEVVRCAQPGMFDCKFAGATRRVIAPSDRLVPLARFPATRFVLTRFADDADDMPWLAWDEVRIFINPAFRRRPLPEALQAPGMPANGYVEAGRDVFLCGDASAVASYLIAHTEVSHE